MRKWDIIFISETWSDEKGWDKISGRLRSLCGRGSGLSRRTKREKQGRNGGRNKSRNNDRKGK